MTTHVEEDEISWPRVIEECLKKRGDPIADMFLEQHAKTEMLEELCHRAYDDSDIRLKDGWVADYKRLTENG